MDNSETERAKPGEPVFPRSHRLIRRLSLVYAALTVAAGVLLLAALLPANVAVAARNLAQEMIAGGLAAIVVPALLLSLTALLGTWVLTTARFRESAADGVRAATLPAHWRNVLQHPGVAARIGQAVIVPAGAILIYVIVRLLWAPTAPAAEAHGGEHGCGVRVCAGVHIAGRRAHPGRLPGAATSEAPTLRRLLLLTTLLLLAGACVELGRGALPGWVRWPQWLLAIVPVLVALELAVRAMARLFLPAPASANARAISDSILAGVLTGGPRSPGVLVRSHFGLDFARSWALSFLSAAILPTLLGIALFCWALTGLKLIDLGHRGIYERFGAPVAVLGPGLHLIMPWPLGRLLPVEFGTIHSVAIGVDNSTSDTAEQVGAEDTPPLSLDRLWESAHSGRPSTWSQAPVRVSRAFKVSVPKSTSCTGWV